MHVTNFLFIMFISTTCGLTDIIVKVGSITRLNCLANTSIPVRWVKASLDNKTINLRYTDSDIDRFSYTSHQRNMIIRTITFEDAGIYTCINYKDNTYKSTRLTIVNSTLECNYSIPNSHFKPYGILNIECGLYYNGSGNIDMKWLDTNDLKLFNRSVITTTQNYVKDNYRISFIRVALHSYLNGTSFICVVNIDNHKNITWSSPNIIFYDNINYENVMENQPDDYLTIILFVVIICIIFVTIVNLMYLVIVIRKYKTID